MSKDTRRKKKQKKDPADELQAPSGGGAPADEVAGPGNEAFALPAVQMAPAGVQTMEHLAASSAARPRRLARDVATKAVSFVASKETCIHKNNEQFWYYQAAGKAGSTAGDAALVSLGDTLLVIDTGDSPISTIHTQWPKATTSDKNSTTAKTAKAAYKRKIFVITHWHSDHAKLASPFIKALRSSGEQPHATLPDWWTEDEQTFWRPGGEEGEEEREEEKEEQTAASASSAHVSTSMGKLGQSRKSSQSDLALITCSRAPKGEADQFYKPAFAFPDWCNESIWCERIGGWPPPNDDSDRGCEVIYRSLTPGGVPIDIGIFDPRLPGPLSNDNDTCLGMLVVVGQWVLLTLSDMTVDAQKKMHAWMPKGVKPTVIKLSHHGSAKNIYLPLLSFEPKPQLLISSGHTGAWDVNGPLRNSSKEEVAPLASSLAVLMQKKQWDGDARGSSFLNGDSGAHFAKLGSARELHHVGKLISLERYAVYETTQGLDAAAAASFPSSISFQDVDEKKEAMSDDDQATSPAGKFPFPFQTAALGSERTPSDRHAASAATKPGTGRQQRSSTSLSRPSGRGNSQANQGGIASETTPASAAASSLSSTKPGTSANSAAIETPSKRRWEGDESEQEEPEEPDKPEKPQ
ncbi:hypothetical protein HSX11_08590 [Oxalobacteraceae bacterium]|nr:hypothetical protein [Oxalobacteraceae bacterium]